MLHDFTITEDGMNQVFAPKAETRIRILINKANNFATISIAGRKDLYDRLNKRKELSDELDRLFERGLKSLG